MSILTTLLAACLVTSSPTTSADAMAAQPAEAAQVAGESFVKLRKIHLVRPDLIAYPLVIDFIC